MTRIKTFGKLTELTAGTEIELPAAADTDTLKALLFERFPALSHMQFSIAVNQRMIRENTALDEHAVIALLPPFSGG